MGCSSCGGRKSSIKRSNPTKANIENYIIDENYDLSRYSEDDLKGNVFTIDELKDGFKVKNGGKIDVYLIYRRNNLQDKLVRPNRLITIKRQIDSRFSNNSNTRKLIAVPV